ncbi:MAG: 1-acyl-sn-glycerol-3-phosphate acyltransferase [Desulfobulbus propionicus]|nr:MAG: 1-acyl-sn-glycerol-3-phosphate acyltransferase [Desulfobulbus propionicus]
MQLLRSLFALLIAFPLTITVSTLALLDLNFFRKSKEKALIFPQSWGRILCKIVGVRVTIEGLDNIEPDQTYIFVANHSSQFDIFSWQGYFPYNFRWIAKKELFTIPIFGQAMRKVGYIPIDRSKGRQALKSLDQAAKQIATGFSVLIFPEGTRTPNGKLQEFKTGAIMLAIKSGVPVVPIGFNGSYPVLPKGRSLPQPGTITIRVGKPEKTSHYKAKDKQALALSLHNAVNSLLDAPYRSEPENPS